MELPELLAAGDTPLGRRVLASCAVVFFAWMVRWSIQRRIRAEVDLDLAVRARWSSQSRMGAFLLLVLGLVFIWGAELRDFLLSLVVLASALVLATKELIMCLTGSFVRAASGGFGIGDRIEIAGHRGDVIDARLLTTTLLESGPAHQRTGRTLVLPNSVFLTQIVANETFTDRYVLHTFDVPLAEGVDWELAARLLNDVAVARCEAFVDDAREHMESVGARHGLPAFDVQPKVTLLLETASPSLRLRVPSRARERGSVEQDILEGFLRRHLESKQDVSSEAEEGAGA